jgi:uncharacterized protein YndB with AHSA1/START domain
VSRELRYERLIQASPARVFDLFTSPAGQREFYGNDAPGWVVDSRCELRVGGTWEIAFGPSPGDRAPPPPAAGHDRDPPRWVEARLQHRGHVRPP